MEKSVLEVQSRGNRSLIDIATKRRTTELSLSSTLYHSQTYRNRTISMSYSNGKLDDRTIQYKNGSSLYTRYGYDKGNRYIQLKTRTTVRRGVKKSVSQYFNAQGKLYRESIAIQRGKTKIIRGYDIRGKHRFLSSETILKNGKLSLSKIYAHYGRPGKRWGTTTAEHYKNGKIFTTRKIRFQTIKGKKYILSDVIYDKAGRLVKSFTRRNGMNRENSYDYKKGIITTKLNGKTICRAYFDKTKGINHIKYREMVLANGKTISTYDREKLKNPKLAGSPSQYLTHLARTLRTPDNVAKFIGYFMHYKNDAGDPLKRMKQHGNEWWQLAKTTVTLIEKGYFRGDCDDYAFLATKLLNLQLQMGLRRGHPAFTIGIPQHALSAWVETKGSGRNKRYYARSIGTFGYDKQKKGFRRLEDAINSIMLKYRYAGLGVKKGMNYKVDPDQMEILTIPKRGKRNTDHRPVEYMIDHQVRSLDTLFATKEYRRAQVLLRQLIQRYPRRHYYKFKLAETYLRTREPKKAEKIYRKLLKSRTIQPLMFFRVLKHLSVYDSDKGATLNAMKRYFRTLPLSKSNVTHILKGIEKNPQLELSTATFQRLTNFILRSYKTNFEAHTKLAVYFSNIGQPQLALKLAEKILSSHFISVSQLEVAFSIVSHHNVSLSKYIPHLQKLLKLSKGKDALAQILVRVYLKNNDPAAALALVKKYRYKISPATLKSIRAQINYALALKNKNLNAQNTAFNRLKQIIDNKNFTSFNNYLVVIQHLQKKGYKAEVIRYANLYIKNHPNKLAYLPTRTIHTLLNHLYQPKPVIQYKLFNILFSRPGYKKTLADYQMYIHLCKKLHLKNKANKFSSELETKQTESLRVALRDARKLMAAHKFPQARVLLERAYRLNPKNEKLLTLLIEHYYVDSKNKKLQQVALAYYRNFDKKTSLPFTPQLLAALAQNKGIIFYCRMFYYKALMKKLPTKLKSWQQKWVNQFLKHAQNLGDTSYFTYARKFGVWKNALRNAKNNAANSPFADPNLRVIDVPGKQEFIVKSHGKQLTVKVVFENGALRYKLPQLNISFTRLRDVVMVANFTNYIRKKYKNRKVESGSKNKAFYVSADLLYFAKPWWDEYVFKQSSVWASIGIHSKSDRVKYAKYLSNIYRT